MWKAGEQPAVVRWRTTPALTTARDTFRLVLGGSDRIGSAVVGTLATVARIAGRARG